MKISWSGKGLSKKARLNNNKIIILCDKRYFRPHDVNSLIGNSTKARKELKWKPKISLNMMIKEMIDFEIKNLNQI